MCQPYVAAVVYLYLKMWSVTSECSNCGACSMGYCRIHACLFAWWCWLINYLLLFALLTASLPFHSCMAHIGCSWSNLEPRVPELHPYKTIMRSFAAVEKNIRCGKRLIINYNLKKVYDKRKKGAESPQVTVIVKPKKGLWQTVFIWKLHLFSRLQVPISIFCIPISYLIDRNFFFLLSFSFILLLESQNIACE